MPEGGGRLDLSGLPHGSKTFLNTPVVTRTLSHQGGPDAERWAAWDQFGRLNFLAFIGRCKKGLEPCGSSGRPRTAGGPRGRCKISSRQSLTGGPSQRFLFLLEPSRSQGVSPREVLPGLPCPPKVFKGSHSFPRQQFMSRGVSPKGFLARDLLQGLRGLTRVQGVTGLPKGSPCLVSQRV